MSREDMSGHIASTSASPFAIYGTHIHLHRRQAIPDATGNTGNIPTAISSLPPAQLPSISPSPPAPTVTTTPTRSSSSTASSTSALTSLPTSADSLILTPTSPLLSPGTLAGIIAGSAIAFLLVLVLAIFVLRRRRRGRAIAEIPIRRSKLGSRLRHRMFNSPLPGTSSRASSRSSGRTLIVEKRDVGRPSGGGPGFGESGEDGFGKGELLQVPRAAFMMKREEEVGREAGERWVGLEISGPRPVRPRSAEPLGRLSGMGMGMGYLR
ncbi:uncharacterized protein CC84DRAFT_1209774 [Paraphaeosphaeria sporulosa]|uniref:Uncharacterized protein n=1 Tax=Paraphaeosphaeria sporulosa TaxID=1460663 RepID=A0A177BZF9_9PLEO|nr:uncharacterized protein CC84DRAFT_1209774 [Paraphaeosphaeria sporulosa]OAG00099.1 hypothetical protein CC84DRAFT_1209774 [Paraphaeosphaeria sporulosa]